MQKFSTLLLSPNRVGNQDRRIYDFYRLRLVIGREEQSRFNFHKQAKGVKSMSENNMCFRKAGSKREELILSDSYGLLQVVQDLIHNNKLTPEEGNRLVGLEAFLDDMETLFLKLTD